MPTSTEVKAEQARRKRLPLAIAKLRKGLTPPQTNCIAARNRRKLYHAGRRGGKTTLLVCEALIAAFEHPGETVLVLEKTLTTQSAIEFWHEIKAVDERYGIGCSFHETNKLATLPNGSVVHMQGSDTEDAADKVRGSRYALVIIDEAGTFRSSVLKYLLEQAVEPALLDLEGSLIVAGTPNRRKVGPFYEMSQGADGFVAFNWSMLDNTALPIVPVGSNTEAERAAWREQQLAELCTRRGWSRTHPTFLREYMGVWAEDVGGGAYHINAEINVIDDFAIERDDKWTFFIGSDLGFNDPCALVTWGRRKGDPYLYVVRSESRPHLPPTRWAAWAQSWRETYRELGAVGGQVADTGGLGKGYVEQARESFNLIFEPANKREKLSHIDFVNGDLTSGRIKIFRRACAELIGDLQELPMNEEGTDVADGYDDHEPDAFLYSHPLASRFQWKGLERVSERPERGTEEYWRRQEARMIEDLEDTYRAQNHEPVEW